MRKILKAIIIVCIIFSAIPTWGKIKCTPIYIFGSAISFTDSLVYITDIQILDSAWVDDKTDFLLKVHNFFYFNVKFQEKGFNTKFKIIIVEAFLFIPWAYRNYWSY